MATGIRDKVAIIGMGCTRFGERWDVGAEELMVEAFEEALADAGIEKKDIGAAWLGTCFDNISVGKSALPLSMTLRLPFIPVTRVENFCATGTEAFRGACYGVASGAYDICLALGVEKLKDTGYGGPAELRRLGLGQPDMAVVSQHHRPGILCPAGQRLRGQVPRQGSGSETRHGPRLCQEPRQRGPQPQGPPEKGRQRGADHGRPHHRPSSGAF